MFPHIGSLGGLEVLNGRSDVIQEVSCAHIGGRFSGQAAVHTTFGESHASWDIGAWKKNKIDFEIRIKNIDDHIFLGSTQKFEH